MEERNRHVSRLSLGSFPGQANLSESLPAKRRKIQRNQLFDSSPTSPTSPTSRTSSPDIEDAENHSTAYGPRGPPNAKRYTVFEAVAGNARKIPTIPPSQRPALYSARSSVLSADQVLFRQKRAPVRYAEDDVYLQHLNLPAGLLPSSDLLKCLHAFVSDFTHGRALRHERRNQPRKDPGEKDNESPQFTFWDQMNEILYGNLPPVSPPPDTDPEYLRWRAERNGKGDNRRLRELRMEEFHKLEEEIDDLGPIPDDDEDRARWEAARQTLIQKRGFAVRNRGVGSRNDKNQDTYRSERSSTMGTGNSKHNLSPTTLNTLFNSGKQQQQPRPQARKVPSRGTRAKFKSLGRSRSPGEKGELSRTLFYRAIRAEKSLDGTALLALGVLAEELCQSCLGYAGHKVLTEGVRSGGSEDGGVTGERYVRHGRGNYERLRMWGDPAPGFKHNRTVHEQLPNDSHSDGDDREEDDWGWEGSGASGVWSSRTGGDDGGE